MALKPQTRIYDRCSAVVFRITSGEFGGLSNMAPDFPLEVNGIPIATTEALYQACRFPDRPDVQALVLDQRSPMTAKMKSKRYRKSTRADWEKVRVKIMRWCLRVKLAQNWSSFSALLLKTGHRPIVEESRKDDFWGAKPQDGGRLLGMNVLGRLLMELRQQLQTGEKEALRSVTRPDISNFLLLGRTIETVEPRERRRNICNPRCSGNINYLAV
jgi:type I restriction enzyme, S subunit